MDFQQSSLKHPIFRINFFKQTCPFCSLDSNRIILSNDHAVAIRDGFPVSKGHTLIIPKRHIDSLFEATAEEQAALFELLGQTRQQLLDELSPNGFNIGINDGAAAGQTVMHLHIHLIPRYVGDQPDPRGGVRWIFPDKAAYWNND
jgi:diadenosine tetraphosphate (Ap4A) HIT family hydrolase